MTFCRDETNKKELFDLLSRKVASFDYPEGKEVYILKYFHTNQQMQGCDHEEADIRLLVHIVDAPRKSIGPVELCKYRCI